MNQIPDIKNLYQKKYLPPSSSSSSEPLQLQQFIRSVHPQKFRLIEHRISNIQTRPAIKYVKIIKNHQQQNHVNFSKTTYCSRKNQKPSIWKSQLGSTQSMHFPQRNNTLIRQLMRVTHQQMGQLQQCAGGEKKLKNMFQQFFQKRNRAKQKIRSKSKRQNFTPLHPKSDIQRRKYSQQGTRTFHRQKISQSAMYEKQLAPWNSPDGQFP